MPQRIKIIRPFTLIPPLTGVLFLSNLYTQFNLDTFQLLKVILTAVSVSMLNGASNILNQITDLVSDRISKPGRLLVTGRISVKSAKIISTES